MSENKLFGVKAPGTDGAIYHVVAYDYAEAVSLYKQMLQNKAERKARHRRPDFKAADPDKVTLVAKSEFLIERSDV